MIICNDAGTAEHIEKWEAGIKMWGVETSLIIDISQKLGGAASNPSHTPLPGSAVPVMNKIIKETY